MKYNEDLLVELVAAGKLSQGKIAERVGISRRTVWRIMNGHARSDLRRRIADTVEGYRQGVVRSGARRMQSLMDKQFDVSLEGKSETSRKAREFLLKMFMKAVPELAEKAAETEKQDQVEQKPGPMGNLFGDLASLSDGLKRQIAAEFDLSKPNYYEVEEDGRRRTVFLTEDGKEIKG